MSSAFLYLAIIAIWAGVLIPRWLKRDSSRSKAAEATQPEATQPEATQPEATQPEATQPEAPEATQPEATQPEATQPESPEATQSPDDDLTDDEPVEVNAGVGADGAGVHMADGNTHAEAEWSGHEPGEPDRLRPADPQTRRRVLSARRRMLMMLIGLAVAAVGIALVGMAAWWVAIPPMAMLGGYLLLLREVRHADTERALIRADAEQRAEEQRLREAQEAVAAKQRAEAQTARIIDISGRVRDELYDQYAESPRRAVGD